MDGMVWLAIFAGVCFLIGHTERYRLEYAALVVAFGGIYLTLAEKSLIWYAPFSATAIIAILIYSHSQYPDRARRNRGKQSV